MIVLDRDKQTSLLSRCEAIFGKMDNDSIKAEDKLAIVDEIVSIFKDFFLFNGKVCSGDKNIVYDYESYPSRSIISALSVAMKENAAVPMYGPMFAKDLVKLLTVKDYTFIPVVYSSVTTDNTARTELQFMMPTVQYTIPTGIDNELFIMFNKLGYKDITYVLILLIRMLSDVRG